MDPITDRLSSCFQTVFPQLGPDQVTTASQASLSAWDSVASITLLNVLEEEFGIQIDWELLPELSSFPLILDHLKSRPDLA